MYSTLLIKIKCLLQLNEKVNYLFIFLFNFSNLYSSEIKFEKNFDDLNKPWSLSFIDKENVNNY